MPVFHSYIRTIMLSSLIALAVCDRRGRSFFFRRPKSNKDILLQTVARHRRQVGREVTRLTRQVNQLARQKGDSLRYAGMQAAEAKRRQVEQEVERLSLEVESLTREKADVYEKATRSILLELERAATNEMQRLAKVAEDLARQKAAQAEESAKRQLATLEQTATEKVTSWVNNFGKNPRAGAVPPKILPATVSGSILNVLRDLVLLSSIMNIAGPKDVRDIWENQGFGDEFFPFEALSLNQKRVLAGCLEFCGFLLLLLGRSPPSPTSSGTGRTNQQATMMISGAVLIAAMFGRGFILNSKRDIGLKILVPGAVTAFALTLILNECVPPPSSLSMSNKKKQT